MKLFSFIAFILLLTVQDLSAQSNNYLQENIQNIISDKDAVVGVSILSESEKGITLINGNRHFPMQSVFKLPIAFYVLTQIDQGKFSLNQEIKITKDDLLPNTWSPIREKYPNGTTMQLSKLIKYTVSKSDNNGCDILLRLIGGPSNVESYLHSIGIKNVSIKVNEEEMHKDWNAQFKNWITPKAANKMLKLFYNNENQLLSAKSYHFIWNVLKETKTGKNKIKGELPKGTIVAHKTGSSGMNKNGITAAENDIGVVTLPNGKHFFISVFVTKSSEKPEINKSIIANIAKASWDYFTKEKK